MPDARRGCRDLSARAGRRSGVRPAGARIRLSRRDCIGRRRLCVRDRNAAWRGLRIRHAVHGRRRLNSDAGHIAVHRRWRNTRRAARRIMDRSADVARRIAPGHAGLAACPRPLRGGVLTVVAHRASARATPTWGSGFDLANATAAAIAVRLGSARARNAELRDAASRRTSLGNYPSLRAVGFEDRGRHRARRSGVLDILGKSNPCRSAASSARGRHHVDHGRRRHRRRAAGCGTCRPFFSAMADRAAASDRLGGRRPAARQPVPSSRPAATSARCFPASRREVCTAGCGSQPHCPAIGSASICARCSGSTTRRFSAAFSDNQFDSPRGASCQSHVHRLFH